MNTDKARQLRKNQTDAERLLWYNLRNRSLLNLKFRRQQPIDRYIVDFVCMEKLLIIELDGGQHNDEFEIMKDSYRTNFLEKSGYTVIRFWNNDVLENIDGVLEAIRIVITNLPHPSPLPAGARERNPT